MDAGLLLVRLVVGLLFVGHGTQKLAGWFGGQGLEGTGRFFASLGFRPGRAHAALAGVAETMGGALLAGGLFTPLGAAAIVGVMTAATLGVHLPRGLWVQNGGYELPLVYAATATALVFAGPGAWSLDAVIELGARGPAWGAGAFALGALAGIGIHLTRAPAPAAQAPGERRAA